MKGKEKIIMKAQGLEAVILYKVGGEYRELRIIPSHFDLNDFDDFLLHTSKNYKAGQLPMSELLIAGDSLYHKVFEAHVCIVSKASVREKR